MCEFSENLLYIENTVERIIPKKEAIILALHCIAGCENKSVSRHIISDPFLFFLLPVNRYQTMSINKELVDFAYKNLNHIPKGEEYEKMILSLPYDIFDPSLIQRRILSSEMTRDYYNLRFEDYGFDVSKYGAAREKYLQTILGKVGEGVFLEPPFYVDYGFNVIMGKNFYANFNLTLLDCTLITFGDNVLCGPNVTFTTATHPTDPKQRLQGVEYAEPITVGNNVWFGSNICVLPGVTIGDNAVIGAGTIVNKDVPVNGICVGVPGKVIKIMKTEEEHDQAVKEMN